MNKTLLKRLLYELIEELIHLEFQIQDLEPSIPVNMFSYLKVLKNRLMATKEQLFRHRDTFLKLFQETALEEGVGEALLETVFPQFRAEIKPLSKAVYRLRKGTVLPETELYLASLSLDKLLPDAPELVVLPAQDSDDTDPVLPSDSVLLEYLPSLALENPLQWMGLLENYARTFGEKTMQVSSLLDSLNIPEPKLDIIAPLLNLRLLGPSYYAYFVLHAFERMDAKAVWVIEPILFQELNRFGLINKDLVILHQGIERGKQHRLLEEPKAFTRSLNNDDVPDAILKIVEKVIPERLAFTEKSLLKSQLLEERLELGMLISAVPMVSSPAQLREDLDSLDTEGSIYPLLHQLQETSASPREIINAGWLYKLDQSANWLQAALIADSGEGWETLKRTLMELDTLLLKSIEISEVHRVLSYDEPEFLVPA